MENWKHYALLGVTISVSILVAKQIQMAIDKKK